MDLYVPPSETAGGWRKNTDPDFVRSLGLSSEKLEAFAAYNLSLKDTSGHTSCLVIKNGWLVGEWYSTPETRSFHQYLSSNGKAYAILLFGMAMEDGKKGALPYALDVDSRVYDKRWLPEGFPLSDPRKHEITFEHIFSHTSGILPEAEEDPGASGPVDFVLYNVGRDPNNPNSARLYFDPGRPEPGRNSYSSVAFNHIGMVLSHLTGQPASTCLWERLLQPLDFSGVEWYTPYWNARDSGVQWYTCSSPKFLPRDYARIAYLLLRDGRWGDRQLVPAGWIRRYRSHPGYPNILSNADGALGNAYPGDLFRIGGSGMNWAFMVPSLDLIAIRTSRAYLSWDEHVPRFLQKLFEAVVD